ncbi:MAG: triose-phosphate isomerase [Deltaproteobacteria bacterium]|nr:triose-phosphate isomerase [Deltaproteobacteria bacterium]
MRQPLIVGNWKMNGNLPESIRLATSLKNQFDDKGNIRVAIAPPFTALYSVSIALAETNIQLAGQNMFWEESGAYTGEVSGLFLKDIGCHYVIIGHSERRQYFHETDEQINLKVQAACKSELVPILCIGENLKERKAKETLSVVEKQLKLGLKDLAIHDFDNIVIAYEPVWAIGTGETASPEQIEEVHHFIRGWLKRFFDAPTANMTKLLYGGSVNPDNAMDLMKINEVDGLLVGGASLHPEDFIKIIKFEENA